MAEVFISYSRKDKPLVTAIHEALRELGRDTWVDWEGIPPTTEWLAEIRAAIESCDNFLFVISPESSTSDVCCIELEHAIQHRKRLIPVVARETPPSQVPAAVAPLNWIFFQKPSHFEACFKALINALDTDFEWVRAHTRLLVRARQWEGKARDDAFLLRGSDLRDAEAWLGSAAPAGSGSLPTALHAEYITRSRKAATKRLRFLVGAVSLALVVAIVLAVVAFIQSRVAEQQRRQAVENAGRADRNAAEARRNEKLAKANADEANRQKAIAQDQTVLAQSNEALAIERNRTLLEERGRLELLEGRWDAAAVLLAEAYGLGSNSPALRLMLARALRPMNGSRAMLPGGSSLITSASFSADGTRAILGELDGTATVWDLRSGSLVAVLSPHDGPIREVHLNTDGSRAVVVFVKTNLDFAENGYYRTYALPVYVWDVVGVTIGEELDVGDWDTYRGVLGPLVDILAGGHRFALPGPNKSFREFDFGGGSAVMPGRGVSTVSTTFSASDGDFQQLAVSTDGRTALLSGPANSVLASERGSRSSPLLASIALQNARIAFRGASSDLVAVNAAGTIHRIWATDNKVGTGNSLPAGTEVVLSPDGRSAVVLCDGIGVPVDLDSRKVMQAMDRAVAARYSANGQFFLSWTKVQSMLFDFWTQHAPSFQPGFSARPAANNDQSIAAVSNFGAVTFADPKVVQVWWLGEPDGRSKGGDSEYGTPAEPTHVEFSPNGRLLATALEDGSIMIRGANAGDDRDPLHADTSAARDLAFSSDSKRLAAATTDGTVKIWDVKSGRVVATCRGHRGSASGVRFSADDHLLATAGSDGTARVWELPSCRELLRFPNHDGAPQVAFDANVTRLATADRKSVRVWELAREVRGPEAVADLVMGLSPACVNQGVAGRWTRPDKGRTRGICATK